MHSIRRLVALAFLLACGSVLGQGTPSGKQIKAHDALVYSLAFSPDGTVLASAGSDNLIKVYDVAMQKEVKQLKGHTDGVTGIAFTPDSKDLVSISQDRTVRLWDVANGKEKKQIGTTQDDLYGLAFSRNGKLFATSGYAGWLNAWKLDADKPIFSQKLKS